MGRSFKIEWFRAAAKIAPFFLLLKASAQQQTPAAYPSYIKINYTRTWIATAPDTSMKAIMGRPLSDSKQTTHYIDGLGRPIQIVVKKGSFATNGTSIDLVSAAVYDQFGRETYQYLPFAANNTGGNTSISDGLFKQNPFQQDSAFCKSQYPGETFYYSQTNYEASPLNRPQSSYPAGNSWVGSSVFTEAYQRSIKIKYWVNTAADSVRIWRVNEVANDFATYTDTAIYPAGRLFKICTTDENGNQVIDFKDIKGKIILKKVQITAVADTGLGMGYSGWLCTYYVYDELSNLRLVIQPKGVQQLRANSWDITALSGAILNEQCFRYEYDQRNRLIRKKVPGAGQVWMVYDARDRQVMLQDSFLRNTHKWLYSQYDSLDRLIATGRITDNTNYNNLNYHLGQAYNSISYPNIGSYTNEELSHNFYDDYTWRGSYSNPLTDTRSTSYDTYLFTASNTTWPYPQSSTQSINTRGLLTGSRTEIDSSGSYLYNVSFYDDRKRVIQSQSTNITGGTDIVTSQYNFNGQTLINVLKQEKTSPNAQNHTIVTKAEYDSLNRLVTLKKSVNSTINGINYSKPEQTIATNQYDKLGQLIQKNLGGSKILDSLKYEYNIRGWLLGANRTYAKDTTSTADYFGYDIGYDKDTILINGLSLLYTNKEYNGNIEGSLWKSKGDGRVRKYDYTYDDIGRLLFADFNQLTGSSFSKNAGIDYSVRMGDGVNDTSAYDANGNILAMNQKGWKLGGSVTIDSLSYVYQNYSNRLAKITDAVSDSTTKLGDFHDGNNGSSDDYSYDGNGNLTIDNNKKITSIIYNFLNLPQQINIAGKGKIVYTYDASGNKLRKILTDSTGGTVKIDTTIYGGAVQYKNDTLLFITHEEGRVRFAKKYFFSGDSVYQYQFDYFLKDHLGNVRVVLTEQKDTTQYLASMEAAYRAKENLLFYNIPQSSYSKSLVPGGYPTDNTTTPNDSLMRLNGSGQKIGAAIVLKVMSGDTVAVGTKAYYLSNTGSGTNSSLTDALTALASGVVTVTSGSKGGFTDLDNPSGQLYNALNSFINSNDNTISGKPRAYLNWVLFDEQFNYVPSSSGAVAVGNYSAGSLATLANSVNITKNGYLYIYVSNETQGWDVFFDNLSIQHIQGPFLEESHYYPFGLTMAGISSKAFGRLINKYKFDKESEFNSDLDINWYETFFRSYDPQIGRFWQIDELGESLSSWSPYVFSNDNPVLLSDPTGLTSDTSITGKIAGVQWLYPVYVTAKINIYQVYINRLKLGDELGIKGPAFYDWDDSYLRERVMSWHRFETKRDEMNHQVGMTIVDIGSFLIPGGEIAELIQVRRAMVLLKIKRGINTAEALEESYNAVEGVEDAEALESEVADQTAAENEEVAGQEKATEGTVENAAKNGETKATANGKAMHKAYRAGEEDGLWKRKEFTLSSGKRVDFIDIKNKIIYELKPNNARAIKLGNKQLEIYIRDAADQFGGEWKGVLDTY